MCINFFCLIYRSYLDTTPNVDYSFNMSRNQDNFSMLISNDDIREMHLSSDGAMQLRAAFLMSLKQNRVQLLRFLNIILK